MLTTTQQAGRRFGLVHSPMDRLPVEVLSSVFRLTIPPPITRFDSWANLPPQTPMALLFPVALGAVSSYWRRVAWSTPFLWTYFHFDTSAKTQGKSHPRLLLLYLQNSGVLPIRLTFIFNVSSEDGVLFDPLVDPVLITNMWRIKMLELSLPPTAWFDHFGKLSAMTDFLVDWGCHPLVKRVFLNKCCSLYRLSLRGFENPGGSKVLYKLPSSITILHLNDIPTDTCVKLLLRCPKLVEIVFLSSQPPHDEFEPSMESSWFGEPVVYEDLETFILERSYDEWASLFLQHTRMPSLRRLRLIDGFYEEQFGNKGENHFFPQIAPVLSVLELQNVGWISEGSRYWILFQPKLSIESLVLDRCAVEIVAELVRRLTPPEGETQRTKPVPRLTSLSILGPDTRDTVFETHQPELSPKEFEPLVLMLERRLVAGDIFRLKFSDVAVDWTPGAQKRLRKLVEKGIDLEIIEDSDEVDWLRPPK